jgi:hypothetical protein
VLAYIVPNLNKLCVQVAGTEDLTWTHVPRPSTIGNVAFKKQAKYRAAKAIRSLEDVIVYGIRQRCTGCNEKDDRRGKLE